MNIRHLVVGSLAALCLIAGLALPAGATPEAKDPPWRLTMVAAGSASAAAAPVYSGTTAIALNPPNFWFTYYGVECWRDGAQKTVYNKTGGALYRAKITVEWCEVNGKITNQTKMTCGTQRGSPTTSTRTAPTASASLDRPPSRVGPTSGSPSAHPGQRSSSPWTSTSTSS